MHSIFYQALAGLSTCTSAALERSRRRGSEPFTQPQICRYGGQRAPGRPGRLPHAHRGEAGPAGRPSPPASARPAARRGAAEPAPVISAVARRGAILCAQRGRHPGRKGRDGGRYWVFQGPGLGFCAVLVGGGAPCGVERRADAWCRSGETTLVFVRTVGASPAPSTESVRLFVYFLCGRRAVVALWRGIGAKKAISGPIARCRADTLLRRAARRVSGKCDASLPCPIISGSVGPACIMTAPG